MFSFCVSNVSLVPIMDKFLSKQAKKLITNLNINSYLGKGHNLDIPCN